MVKHKRKSDPFQKTDLLYLVVITIFIILVAFIFSGQWIAAAVTFIILVLLWTNKFWDVTKKKKKKKRRHKTPITPPSESKTSNLTSLLSPTSDGVRRIVPVSRYA